MEKINFENWERKDHFDFFKDYDDPFYNICADIDVTNLHSFCEKNNLSFFISSLYLSQKTVNQITELKYRIRNGEVYKCDNINAGSTVLNNNKTFGFCYYEYFQEFSEFYQNTKQVLDERDGTTSLINNPYEDNIVYYSVIPWISFKSMSHPKKHIKDDSIPRIVFGKYFKINNNLLMPVSIEVNHSLVDGYHLGQYFELFSNFCENPLESLI